MSDWAFLFAFPTDRRSFEQSFAWNFTAKFDNWDHYRSRVLDPFTELIVPLESAGLSIYRWASLLDLTHALRSKKAVILFTHHEDGELEFRARMVPFDRVLAVLPLEFDGIFELSACKPTEKMVLDVRARCRQCGVPYMADEITPYTWLIYYALLLKEFDMSPTSYRAADVVALEEFRKKLRV
ncbi:hypothetical protein GR210_12425 [Rhizobium leguminosarum]|uniref:hypothetical protein n=1 Tax=Rhizobium leguminosarum TaxID=384 RepID=UPI0013DD3BD5|nr:hypothetical protein [Rhizobium leguminosarum]NEH49588.1 hypothetical protein [Rhizobium leguminosarum]